MTSTLYLASKEGILTVQANGRFLHITDSSLTNHDTTCLANSNGALLAGTQDGLFRTTNGGVNWTPTNEGLHQRHLRWLAIHPDDPDLVFAGTEPAAIFVSTDGGRTWQEKPEVADLRDRYGWWLPYSPESGCIRGFAVHGDRIYAAAEVGGLLRSDDRGKSWQLAAGSDGQPRFGSPSGKKIHPDVHSVVLAASSADWVFAPTGGGFYCSQDGGATWALNHDGNYVRAVWVDPGDPEKMVIGPADDSSGKNGRIVTTHDGGSTWTELAGPWQRMMVERFATVDDQVLAVMSNGQLWQSPASGPDRPGWQHVLPNAPHITAVAA